MAYGVWNITIEIMNKSTKSNSNISTNVIKELAKFAIILSSAPKLLIQLQMI